MVPYSNTKLVRFKLNEFETMQELDINKNGFGDYILKDNIVYLIPKANQQSFVKINLDTFTIDTTFNLNLNKYIKTAFISDNYLYAMELNASVFMKVNLTSLQSENVNISGYSIAIKIKNFTSSFVHNDWAYLIPGDESNVLTRIKLNTFNTDPEKMIIEYLKLDDYNEHLRDFSYGFNDGTWCYLIPFTGNERGGKDNNYSRSGYIARFLLSDFETIQFINLADYDTNAIGFSSGFIYKNKIHLSPNQLKVKSDNTIELNGNLTTVDISLFDNKVIYDRHLIYPKSNLFINNDDFDKSDFDSLKQGEKLYIYSNDELQGKLTVSEVNDKGIYFGTANTGEPALKWNNNQLFWNNKTLKASLNNVNTNNSITWMSVSDIINVQKNINGIYIMNIIVINF